MIHRMSGIDIHMTQSYFIVSYPAMVCLLGLLLLSATGFVFLLVRTRRTRKPRLES